MPASRDNGLADPYEVTVSRRVEATRTQKNGKPVTRWVARCRLEDRGGMRIQVSAKTEQQARSRLQKKRDAALLGNPNRRGNPTVAEWLTPWVKGEKGGHPNGWRTSTAKRNRQHVAGLLRRDPMFGRLRLTDVKPSDVSNMVKQLEKPFRAPKAPKTEPGTTWAPRSIRNAYAVVRVGLRDALAEGLIKNNPALGVMLTDLGPRKVTVLGPDDQAMVLHEALVLESGYTHVRGEPRYRYGDCLALLLLTGMRSGEVRALRRKDISKDFQTINISRTISVGKKERVLEEEDLVGLHEGKPKSDAGRRAIEVRGLASQIVRNRVTGAGFGGSAKDFLLFPAETSTPEKEIHLSSRILNAQFQAVLKGCVKTPWMRSPEKWLCPVDRPLEIDDEIDVKDRVVELCTTCKQTHKRAPHEYGDAVCKKCGHKHLHATVHSLRHTAITRWVNEQKLTTWTAAYRAGHRSVWMVTEVYAHGTPESDREAAERDEQHFAELKTDLDIQGDTRAERGSPRDDASEDRIVKLPVRDRGAPTRRKPTP